MEATSPRTPYRDKAQFSVVDRKQSNKKITNENPCMQNRGCLAVQQANTQSTDISHFEANVQTTPLPPQKIYGIDDSLHTVVPTPSMLDTRISNTALSETPTSSFDNTQICSNKIENRQLKKKRKLHFGRHEHENSGRFDSITDKVTVKENLSMKERLECKRQSLVHDDNESNEITCAVKRCHVVDMSDNFTRDQLMSHLLKKYGKECLDNRPGLVDLMSCNNRILDRQLKILKCDNVCDNI